MKKETKVIPIQNIEDKKKKELVKKTITQTKSW